MINRLSVALLLVVFALNLSANESTISQAEALLSDGDLEGALEHYLVALEEDPGNSDVADTVVLIASELGLSELSAEVLIGQVGLSIAGDGAKVSALHDRLTALYGALPVEAADALAAISAVDDEETGIVLNEMKQSVQEAMAGGDMAAALEAQESVLMIAQEMLGEAHWETVAATRDMGYLYRTMGSAEDADAFYNEAMGMAMALLGDTHPKALEIVGLLVELYAAAGGIEDALALNDMVIEGYEQTLGSPHELTLGAKLMSVTLFEALGDYGSAAAVGTEVCATYEAGYGLYHPGTLDCLNYLSGLTRSAGELESAEAHYTLLLERMSAVSPIDEVALGTLSQLGELYRQQGRYEESGDLLTRVIQTAAQTGAVEVSFTARSYLARVFRDVGNLNGAETVFNDVLEYGLANWQAQPLNIYNTMLELGSVYQARGLLNEAEAVFEEAWTWLSENVGTTHESTLVALNNLGQVYEKQGLYDLAEPVLKQTVTDMEAVLGPESAQASRARSNLAALHESQGNFREAEPLYLRSLALLGQSLGDNHSDTVAIRNNLAYLYMMMEQHDSASAIFSQVTEQWTQIFGADHQSTLKARNNLGRSQLAVGKLVEAEQIVLEALQARQRVLGAEHLDSIRSMIDLGEIYRRQDRLEEAENLLTSALSIAESTLSEQHPYTFEALRNLARVKEARGLIQAAVDLRRKGFARRSVFLDRMLWVTGENAREGYLRLHRDELNEYLALLTRIDPADGGRLAIDASLQRKGLLLKITSEIQQISQIATDPAMRAIADDLEQARKDLAALTLSGPTVETQGRHVEALYGLEQRVNELQGELGRASVRYRSSIAQVSVDSLTSVLSEDRAFVDFLAFEEGEDKKILAAVVTNDGELNFDLVVYESRSDVDDVVIEYRTIIQDDLADEDELLEIGQIAFESVWQPLEESLGDMEYVYLIPDGILNILPFNALVNLDEEYLIQTHDLHLLTSGRDLLPNEYSLARGDYLIVAGPDYDSDDVVSEDVLNAAEGRRSAALKLGIRGVGGGLRGLSFAPLPGAEQEGRIITTRVVENNKVSEMYFGQQAQEQILASIGKPPEILHMATHGFFLEADDTLRNRILKAQRSADIHVPPPGDNPLLRAGLAFAGINNNAQFLGDIDTVNDGVLTALEVLDLNLSGTRLVVLSACETGLGEIHEGEGVYGLRRSFQEAGVAEVISSLWEVSDAGTQALMTDFYDRVLKGTPAREALRDTQLDLLDSPEWGYPYVWSAFMIVGSYESAGITIQ